MFTPFDASACFRWDLSPRVRGTGTGSHSLTEKHQKTSGNQANSVSPNLMVVFGAAKHVRPSYRLWEEPKAPDFVLHG